MSEEDLPTFDGEWKIIPLQPPTPKTQTTSEKAVVFFGKLFSALVLLVLMLIAGYGIWNAFSNLSHYYRYNEVDGYINSTYIIKHPHGFLTSYTITYFYTVGDIQYTGKNRVSEKPTNIKARVFYDPQDPKISKLEFRWKLSLFTSIVLFWIFPGFKSFFSSPSSPSENSYR